MPFEPRYLGGRYIKKVFTGKPCLYCGRPMRKPTKDHIVPMTLGGNLNRDNCAIVCESCNTDKGHLTLEEFHDRLIEKNDPRAFHVRYIMDNNGTAKWRKRR